MTEGMTEERTKEELDRLAVGILRGSVFTDRHVHGLELRNVFLPLALMSQEQMEKLKEGRPGMLFEDMDKAGPRAINGMPMFASFQVLTEAETEKVWATVARLEEAEKQVLAAG